MKCDADLPVSKGLCDLYGTVYLPARSCTCELYRDTCKLDAVYYELEWPGFHFVQDNCFLV